MKTATDKKQKFKDIPKETVSEWKSNPRYAGVIEVPIDPDDFDKNAPCARFYAKKPSRDVLYAVTTYGTKNQWKKAHDVLITNCILGGDMEYLEDEDIFLDVIEEIGELRNAKRSRLKKH